DRWHSCVLRAMDECGGATSRAGGMRLSLGLGQQASYDGTPRQCQLKTQKNQNGKMLDARGCLPYQIQSKGCCAISPQGSLMARLWSPFFPACPLDRRWTRQSLPVGCGGGSSVAAAVAG